MRRIVLTIILLVVTVWSAGPIPTHPVQAQFDGCEAVNSPDFDDFYFSGAVLGGDFEAGDTLVITADFAEQGPASPAAGVALAQRISITLEVDGVTVDSDGVPGELNYTFTEDGEASVRWFPTIDIGLDWTAQCTRNPIAVPGCDAFVYLPSWSVVGAFVSSAQTYWAPDLTKATTNPSVVIPASKTAWVLGMDSSQSFYKILWSCGLLWVPVETMGPNFDAVWQGTPLPTQIVS